MIFLGVLGLFLNSAKQFEGDLVIATKLKIYTKKTTITACPSRFTTNSVVSLKIKRQKDRLPVFTVAIG